MNLAREFKVVPGVLERIYRGDQVTEKELEEAKTCVVRSMVIFAKYEAAKAMHLLPARHEAAKTASGMIDDDPE